MVSKIGSIFIWNSAKLVIGLCLLSLVIGIEFFIGLDVIEIEKWIANHPYHFILVISIIMIILRGSSHRDSVKHEEKHKRYFIYSVMLLCMGAGSIYYLADKPQGPAWSFSFYEFDFIKLLSMAGLYYVDFQFIDKISIDSKRVYSLFIVLLSTLVSSFTIFLLFQDFSQFILVFSMSSFLYGFLFVFLSKRLSRAFLLFMSIILSFLTMEASRYDVQLEYGFVILFGFVLIEYLLRSSRKC